MGRKYRTVSANVSKTGSAGNLSLFNVFRDLFNTNAFTFRPNISALNIQASGVACGARVVFVSRRCVYFTCDNRRNEDSVLFTSQPGTNCSGFKLFRGSGL